LKPLLIALTTSLTPLFMVFSEMAWRINKGKGKGNTNSSGLQELFSEVV